MRLLGFFLLLALVLCIPFLTHGAEWDLRFSQENMQRMLSGGGYQWGWLLAMLLLIGDLLLPVPATAVMSALGYVYGWLLGGMVAATGSFLSGTVAYLLCRRFGLRAAQRLMGPQDHARGQRIFAGKAGGWLVALSRCLPLMPEVVACMAGLSRMPAARFFPALACGSLPLGFVFAAAGASGRSNPALALGLSAGIPVVLYLISLAILRRPRQ